MERFNKEASKVRNLDDKTRLFWMKGGLRKGSLFEQDVGINKPKNLAHFLRKYQKYMDYEEDNMAYKAVAENESQREMEPQGTRQKKESRRDRHDVRPSRFNNHTLLNASRSRILAECANKEFIDIKRPEPLVLREGQNPSKKHCHYHRSNGHDTDGCRALKDDIEELIREGKLSQYIRKEEDNTCDFE